MSSFLDKNDDAFVAQVRANKNVERTIARLSRARAWAFWLLLVVSICSLFDFILSCVAGKPDFGTWLGAFGGAFFFLLLDSQVKAFKFVRRDEPSDKG